ncbi:MAG: hypothetical protein OXG25_06545 [Gammaproteobacteria bacterium]|nr:hypothetical protein [Gammaproteobacteria bacterium]
MTLTDLVRLFVETVLSALRRPLDEDVIKEVFKRIERQYRGDYNDLCANANTGSQSINPLIEKSVGSHLQATVKRSGVSAAVECSLITSYSKLHITPIRGNF